MYGSLKKAQMNHLSNEVLQTEYHSTEENFRDIKVLKENHSKEEQNCNEKLPTKILPYKANKIRILTRFIPGGMH